MKNKKEKLRGEIVERKQPGMKAPIYGGSSENEGIYMGHGEFANMPQHSIMVEYPDPKAGMTSIDDTISRLDSDTNDSRRKKKKDMNRGMY